MKAQPKEALKDASHLLDVERYATHAARPGFRITELQLSPTQTVPWHCHNNISDTFYVLEGRLRLSCRIRSRTSSSAPARATPWSRAARIW